MDRQLLLIRHAERPDIPWGELGNNVLLTEKGKQDSSLFGKKLDSNVVSVVSSPVRRCVETAEILADSKGFDTSAIQLDYDLGDPGYIITDGRSAWQHWLEKGHDSVFEYLLSGEDDWHGFANLKETSQQFAEKIKTALRTQPPGLNIWVTHDVILATFVSRIMPTPLSMAQWPGFLGNVVVSLTGDELSYRYRPVVDQI